LSIYQYIPQIEVACGDNISALVFRNLQPFSDSDIEKLREFENKHNIKLYSQSGGIDMIKPIFSGKKI
jgi:23S rRNA (uracil1939-C5)-methyltransferase